MKRKLHLAFAFQTCCSLSIAGLILLFNSAAVQAQISVTGPAFTHSQDFNTLANTGTSSTVPAGWAFSETGANQNALYTAGTGSDNGGDTYSFGLTGNTERAFGGLRSGSLIPTVGVCFTNNTDKIITSFTVTYTGETWRVGAATRTDGVQFQYNQSTTGINGAGTWTSFSALDYFNPGQAISSGSMLHSALVSSTIAGLNILPGATFCLRWNDFNATGADDGIGIDDFSISNFTLVCPDITATINGAGGFCGEGNTSDGTPPLNVTITGSTGLYTIDYTDGLSTDYPAIPNYVSGTAIPEVVNFTTTFSLVSVTAASGCPITLSGSTATFFVSDGVPVVTDFTLMHPSCANDDGEISITMTEGGQGGYTYTWSTANGSGLDPLNTTSTQSNLGSGTYDVIIADANGCENADPISYTLNPAVGCNTICPTFSGSTNPSLVCNGGDFSFAVTGLTNMAQADNNETNFGINFVVFPAAVADPYTAPGGTLLGSVPFASLGGGGTTATLTIMNTTLLVGNYVAYGILSPVPANISCRLKATFNFEVVQGPELFNVTGGGSTCENGGTGFPIGLSGSQPGFTYNLFLNDLPPAVATVVGNGNPLNFGNFSTAGTYNVVVTDNTGASCVEDMNGSATITALPESPVPTVTSPVLYCQGDVATPLTANGVNLLWYTSLADPTGDATAPTPSTASVGNTSYYVSQTT
ncbi:MAG: hypothetical protein IT262_23520, partial [Saprospiraceae bacterium]|nr:hypothetical protein [Saprospiraceae bacterium]